MDLLTTAEPLTAGVSGVEGLVAIALDTWTLVLAGGIYFGLRSLDGILGGNLIWRRLLPLMPELLGLTLSICHCVPSTAMEPLMVRVAIGLWLAYVSKNFRKILGQTVLGDDAKITEHAYRRKLKPSTPPVPPADGGT